MFDFEFKREMLQVILETREQVAYLAHLAQNGKDETRLFDEDWRRTNEALEKLAKAIGNEELQVRAKALNGDS